MLVALAPELAQLLYGQQYQASGSLLRIASLWYVFNILAILNFTLLSALGKVKVKTLLTLGVGVLNVFLNRFFIRWWGVYGALGATIVGWLILGGVSWFLLRGQRPRILWSLVLKSGLFCVLAAALVFVLLKLLAGEMLGFAWMSNLAVVGL
ncbi:MAG: polysaccharide biosynthesis C-terminal domain-containing protein [bacterium]|nr:polysaccharide biosynthesis C-terminal domain-containing protein [bacterium]